MINEKVQDALNGLINAEFGASYHYLATAAYFKSLNLDGFAGWMLAQSEEELLHAMKEYNYINDRGGRVKFEAVEKPRYEWATPLEAWQDALDHEVAMTKNINRILDIAIGESDHATVQFLQWFVEEQVEEEATAESIVNQLKLIGDNGFGLLMLDKELGQRVPNAGQTASAE